MIGSTGNDCVDIVYTFDYPTDIMAYVNEDSYSYYEEEAAGFRFVMAPQSIEDIAIHDFTIRYQLYSVASN